MMFQWKKKTALNISIPTAENLIFIFFFSLLPVKYKRNRRNNSIIREQQEPNVYTKILYFLFSRLISWIFWALPKVERTTKNRRIWASSEEREEEKYLQGSIFPRKRFWLRTSIRRLAAAAAAAAVGAVGTDGFDSRRCTVRVLPQPEENPRGDKADPDRHIPICEPLNLSINFSELQKNRSEAIKTINILYNCCRGFFLNVFKLIIVCVKTKNKAGRLDFSKTYKGNQSLNIRLG